METSMLVGCPSELSSDPETLTPSSLSAPAVWDVTTVQSGHRRQLDRNVRVALAAEELKAAVDSAVSTARELRTKLEASQA
jgi:hypothetical protein